MSLRKKFKKRVYLDTIPSRLEYVWYNVWSFPHCCPGVQMNNFIWKRSTLTFCTWLKSLFNPTQNHACKHSHAHKHTHWTVLSAPWPCRSPLSSQPKGLTCNYSGLGSQNPLQLQKKAWRECAALFKSIVLQRSNILYSFLWFLCSLHNCPQNKS